MKRLNVWPNPQEPIIFGDDDPRFGIEPDMLANAIGDCDRIRAGMVAGRERCREYHGAAS